MCNLPTPVLPDEYVGESVVEATQCHLRCEPRQLHPPVMVTGTGAIFRTRSAAANPVTTRPMQLAGRVTSGRSDEQLTSAST